MATQVLVLQAKLQAQVLPVTNNDYDYDDHAISITLQLTCLSAV